MNPPNEPSAVGVFDNLEKAERTIDELRRVGFSADEIGIIGHVGEEQSVPKPLQMQAPEDNAINGLIEGSILGAIIGTFVILVIPGLGEVSGLGRWFEFIGGAALGAVAGGVLIAFGSLVFSRPRTRFFVSELEKGHFIVTVKNPQRKSEAVEVLRRQGASADRNAS
jgi:hypothetical protein